jgi:hypothetical protein
LERLQTGLKIIRILFVIFTISVLIVIGLAYLFDYIYKSIYCELITIIIVGLLVGIPTAIFVVKEIENYFDK